MTEEEVVTLVRETMQKFSNQTSMKVKQFDDGSTVISMLDSNDEVLQEIYLDAVSTGFLYRCLLRFIKDYDIKVKG